MNTESTWNTVFHRIMQAAKCTTGTTEIDNAKLYCAVCGKEVQQQCSGCKSYFCQPCAKTHVQDNLKYLNPAIEEQQA